MDRPIFKRKIYNEILEWKEKRSDKYALLIKGARRVGKSTIAEEFARDFAKNSLKSFSCGKKCVILHVSTGAAYP